MWVCVWPSKDVAAWEFSILSFQKDINLYEGTDEGIKAWMYSHKRSKGVSIPHCGLEIKFGDFMATLTVEI